MTKQIAQMSARELIWKAQGEVASARRIAQRGGNPDKALGIALSALQRYRVLTGQ